MNITRNEIAPGVFLTEAEGPYKKSRLAIYAASPLARETITRTAMLPFVLERGTAKLPDMTRLKRYLNELYGARMSTNYSVSRFNRVLEGYIEGVDGALVQDGAEVSHHRAGLLFDVLFDPYAPQGAFDEEWVDIEREKLRETILSIINDKRDYCAKLLMEAFFAGDERSLPSDGYEEDLAAIDGANLYAAYSDFIGQAGIEIIYVGAHFARLREAVLSALSGKVITPGPARELTPVAKKPEQEIVREMEIEQAKLALAFTPGRLLQLEELAQLRVACGILGASPTSRLFTNVREKKSLCYYVTAQPSYRAGGGIVIECGVAHEDAGRARDAILEELNQLAADGPNDTELEQIKRLYRNVLRGVTDSSGALANYCYANITKYGRPLTPDEELESIDAVTAQQVRSLLGEMHLNTSCLLYKGGAR